MRRKKQEAVRNKDIVQYDIFEAYQTHYKDAIAKAYDETYFKAIWDNFLGFTHITVAGTLEHLTEKCLVLTFKEKKKNLKEINLTWGHGDDIRVSLVTFKNSRRR